MRFLADESCDFTVVRALRQAGHDALAVADVARGAEDPVVVDFARNEGRVLITEDKDFGGLVYAALGDAATGGVILVRFPSTARSVLGAAVRETIDRLGATLEGQFVVVEPGRVRVGRGRRT